MLTRILAGVAIAALAIAFWSNHRYQLVTERLTVAEAQVKGYKEHAAYLQRLRAANEGWDRLVSEVGNSDVPLSGYLAGAAGRLWP